MAPTLTPAQARVFDFIRAHVARHGYPPTYAEIADGLGFRSANAAAQHVRLLAKKGYCETTPGVARGLRLIEPEPGLRVVGEVAAGQPILAEENVERRVAIDPGFFQPRADYPCACAATP